MLRSLADRLSIIGNPVSVVDHSNLRYKGILSRIDPEARTICLSDVVCFGTRLPSDKIILPLQTPSPTIIFKVSDVKDFALDEPTTRQSVHGGPESLEYSPTHTTLQPSKNSIEPKRSASSRDPQQCPSSLSQSQSLRPTPPIVPPPSTQSSIFMVDQNSAPVRQGLCAPSIQIPRPAGAFGQNDNRCTSISSPLASTQLVDPEGVSPFDGLEPEAGTQAFVKLVPLPKTSLTISTDDTTSSTLKQTCAASAGPIARPSITDIHKLFQTPSDPEPESSSDASSFLSPVTHASSLPNSVPQNLFCGPYHDHYSLGPPPSLSPTKLANSENVSHFSTAKPLGKPALTEEWLRLKATVDEANQRMEAWSRELEGHKTKRRHRRKVSEKKERPTTIAQEAGGGREQRPKEKRQDQRRYSDLHDHSRALILDLIANPSIRDSIISLTGDDAQCMVNFLSTVLTDDTVLDQVDRRRTLHLLAQLAKSAQVFPERCEMQDVECDFSRIENEGSFGFIHKGRHHNRNICVKAVRVYQKKDNRQNLRAHAKELILSAHLSHPHILPFYGVYFPTETVQRICIVSPWMVNGDLASFLDTFPDTLPLPLLSDIIAGLLYLHGLNIVHADLKAHNILVSRTKRALIADFGISRVLMTDVVTTQLSSGTANWMAPELFLEEDAAPTQQSDIWAFSCVCYEVFTGGVPFSQYKHTAQLISALMREPGMMPSRPTVLRNGRVGTIDDKVWELMQKCWNHDPAKRPDCEEIRNLLGRLSVLDDRSEIGIADEGSMDATDDGLVDAVSTGREVVTNEVDYHRVYEILREALKVLAKQERKRK